MTIAREPVQGWGAIICADRHFETVCSASQNLGQHTGIEVADIIGHPAAGVFDEVLLHEVRNRLGHRHIAEVAERIGRQRIGNRLCDLFVHRSGDLAVLELLPLPPTDIPNGFCAPAVDHLHLLIRGPDGETRDVMLRDALGRFRVLTGIDRVMAIMPQPDRAGFALEFGSFGIAPDTNGVMAMADAVLSSMAVGPLFIPDLDAPMSVLVTSDDIILPGAGTAMILRPADDRMKRSLIAQGFGSAVVLPVHGQSRPVACLVAGAPAPQVPGSGQPLQIINVFARIVSILADGCAESVNLACGEG
ncbi:MAG: hypothetical protein AAF367_09075 [Pseudomonadota bacterium]